MLDWCFNEATASTSSQLGTVKLAKPMPKLNTCSLNDHSSRSHIPQHRTPLQRDPEANSAPAAKRAGAANWISGLHVCGLACAVLLGVFASSLVAEEPYQRFLEKLRDERLFDLALVYLGDLEDQPNVSEEFKAVIALERGVLLYSAASQMSAQNAQRPVKLDQAEAAMRTFLKNRPQHPRRGEAQLSLGNLLLARAEEAKTKAGPDNKQDIPEAIKFFSEAHDLFQETVKELAAVLEQIKGARTDATDASQVDYRKQVRGEIRRAQLLAAAAMENRGRSRAESSAERKTDLEAALGMYNDLYLKEKEIVSIRNYALFYRSGLQETLGKVDDAIDGYQRIADQEGIDSLRMLQTQAITELVRLFTSQGKFPLADERAAKWESQIRPDERQSPEVLAFKLQYVTSRVAWIKDLEKKDKNDRTASKLTRETRDEVRALTRIPGPHQEAARKLLGELGAEPAAPKTAGLPQVKNFAEALEAATERIQRTEANSIDLATLEQQLADPAITAEDKQAKGQQLADAKEAVRVDFEQATQLLRTGLRLFSKKDERELLFEARQKLAFCLLKQQQPWEAIAIGEFLALSNPRTEQGLQAGTIALAAYGELFKTEDKDRRTQLIDQLQPFAEYLVLTWPDSEESGTAASALVQLALINKEWAKAEKFLEAVTTTSAASAKLFRDAALQFYALYGEAKRANPEETPDLLAARKRAFDSLIKAAAGIKQESMGGPEIEVINNLARLYVADNQVEAAAKLLDNPELSPLQVLKDKPDSVTTRVAMDTYRTALQVEIGKLTSGVSDAVVATKRIGDLVGSLEEASKKEADGPQVLAGIFVQLARDLKDSLASTKEVDKRQKLSEALVKVTSEAGKKATAFGTNYWAADTLLSVAEELKGDSAQAKLAYSEASAILDQMLVKGKADADWMQPKGIELQVKLLLAKSQRGNGQFDQAIDTLSGVLESANIIVAQMEAAKTYQAWGDASDPKYHKSAIEGDRPGKNGANIIWGFSKIANVASKNPNSAEQFYEARYQVANSRYKFALGGEAKNKTTLLEQAAKDIQSTARLYPALGGPDMTTKFDALLKLIQKAQGQEAVGLVRKAPRPQ